MLRRWLPILVLALLACSEDAADQTTGASAPSGTGPSGAGGAGGDDSTGGSPAGGGGSGGCMPLDADTLHVLALGIEDDFALQPGDSLELGVGVVECCYTFTPVNACVTFSVDPAQGASIDADGLLQIDASTTAGSVYTVTADVELGKKVLTAQVTVWTPETHPLVGTRTEVAQLPCASGPETPPETPIGELRFKPNGEFQVTWTPFELYVDYWGTYTFDLGAKTLALTVAGGNYVPPDVDGAGTFEIQTGDELVLHDVWLGTPQGGTAPPGCGHRFH